VKINEMLSDGGSVGDRNNPAVDIVLDLEGDTTGVVGDNGDSFVDGL
jgi:hypothetical protein